ncbi:DNA polymerase III subunit chi, partial [Pseudomonas syringae pv. syringae]
LLFDVVGARPDAAYQQDFDEDDIPTLTPDAHTAPAPQAQQAAQPQALPNPDALLHLDNELRAAARLIMQDVIDDFAPHIENEIKRRLEARLERLLAQQQK